MQAVAITLFLLLFIVLLVIAGITPRRSRLSRYELQRRHERGDAAAHAEFEREALVGDMLALQRIAVATILVLLTLASVGAFGWLFGVIASVVVALSYQKIAAWEILHGLTDRIYQPYDETVVRFIKNRPYISHLVRSVAPVDTVCEVGSREELEHVIMQSGNLLTSDEKKLLISGLQFRDKKVESIMTPRGVIVGVPKTELVGPLMLDELHRTGHSRFPVYDGNIDHVIGVLHIRELLALLDKKSQTAEKAMEKKVYYIHQSQTLHEALAAFLKTRHHLFIVVNGYRETAGIVTLEDVVEALLGREIVDEFDIHDDLRAVAAREAKSNNNPPEGVDV